MFDSERSMISSIFTLQFRIRLIFIISILIFCNTFYMLSGNSLKDDLTRDVLTDSISRNQSFLFFTSVEVLDRNKQTILNADEITEIVVSARFKYIKINFKSISVPDAKGNEIEYSLSVKNGKTEWIPVEGVDYVILARLRPGEYSLRLKHKELHSIIGLKSAIIIKQHPYTNLKAIFLYVLIFTGIIFALLRFQTRTLRKISRQFRERDRLALQLMKQKEELTIKNKNITDSITYAKRIQNALMPPEKLFKMCFPESFILHISKDIVSGDFYWVNETKDKIFIAAVDCTGHGVPGAFMSIIGFELFRKITNIQGIKRPSEILNTLNDDFNKIFMGIEDLSFKDGMDVAFCAVDKNKRILEFSGAFNPLYLIRDNTITEIKADRFPIGPDSPENQGHQFTNHSIELKKDDVFYIFSDGFADQFGGPEGKKFKYRRFRHLLLALNQLSMEYQQEYLYKSIMEWKGELDQVDDILVIGVRIIF